MTRTKRRVTARFVRRHLSGLFAASFLVPLTTAGHRSPLYPVAVITAVTAGIAVTALIIRQGGTQ